MYILPLSLKDTVHCLCCISSAEGWYVAMKALPICPIVHYSPLDFFTTPNGCDGREGGSTLTAASGVVININVHGDDVCESQ